MTSPGDCEDIKALSIQKQASEWLEKSLDDTFSEADQVALESWLAESASHKLAYWRLNAAWNRSERLAALRPLQRTEPQGKQSRRTRNAGFLSFGFAAAIAVGAAVWAGLIDRPSEIVAKTFSTPIGGRQLLKLADGSQIELNTNTVAHIAFEGRARKVILDRGEAFFQIKHDPARPFIVTTQSHRIVDIGTKFLVRSENDKLRVTLVEGEARLESSDSKTQALLLTPGDVAVATSTTMSVVAKPISALANQLSWRRGLLVFDNTKLADVAREFNRYNTTQLVIADEDTAKLAIGGTFRADDIESFAEVAHGLLHLKVKSGRREIVISR